jgi:hypothetical protein
LVLGCIAVSAWLISSQPSRVRSTERAEDGWSVRWVRWVSLAAAAVVAAVAVVCTALALLVGSAPVRASSCAAETEPNDQPDTAITLNGAGCATGSLPDGDGQDTWVWTVGNSDAAHTWTITFHGIAGVASEVELVPITSAPGTTPIAWNNTAIAVVTAAPDSPTANLTDAIIPAGQYVLGVGRTSSVSGTALSSTDYEIDLAPGDPLPQNADAEPNDDPSHPGATERSAFSVSGDAAGSDDVFAWTLDAEAATHRWQAQLQVGLGTGEQVWLLGKDGSLLTSTAADANGLGTLYDLQLPAGRYLFRVLGDTRPGPHPYVLSTTATDVPGSDPEPNDDPGTAAPATVGQLVNGRLARAGDVDQFALTLDANQAQDLLDVRLLWRDGPDRRICISSLDANLSATQLKCSVDPQHVSGRPGGATFIDGLFLRAGAYVVTVTGDRDPSAIYALRVDGTSPPAPDFETEPNDTPDTATPMTPSTVMRGRATHGDVDVYRVTVTGNSQVWTAQLAGSQLDALTWIDISGLTLSNGDVSDDRSSAVLEDVYMPPGDYLFQVASDGGDYTLSFTAKGPPTAHAELEPDNDSIHAMVMQLDQPMLGRLPQSSDIDVYRFSLTAPEHVLLQVDPPADGGVSTSLMNSAGATVAFSANAPPGQAWHDDLQLQPGDYELWLRPNPASKSSYQVLLGREDPFAFRQDQEPDDFAAEARPMPPSLHITGTSDQTGDKDWYRIDPLSQPATITVTAHGSISTLTMSDGTNGLPESQSTNGDAVVYTIGPTPTGVPLYLVVNPTGDYDVVVSGIPAPTGPSVPAPDLAAQVSVTLANDPIAAYWNAGQEVSATVSVTSTGSTEQQLSLDAATSHYAWTLNLSQTTVTVDPGQTVTVPATLDVLPDAWAGIPVRVTVRARDTNGAQSTGFAEVTPGRDALPAAPHLAWSVPDALLGGLDVAASGLGATPVPSVDPMAEARLYDGIEHTLSAFTAVLGAQPLALTVDLAGDSPDSVAGMIIDPLTPIGQTAAAPRDVTFSLSMDGQTWQDVLHAQVSTLPLDQSFVLPAPVPARFARLTIDSSWADTGVPIAISEWKVIAQPGFSPTAEPLNVADAALGGHVVWADPPFNSQDDAQRMLDPTASPPQTIFAPKGTAPTWVLGFRDDRAARLTELDWVDPSISNPAYHLKKVAVSISTDSPLGPWTDVGNWNVSRRGDGSVAPFTFDSPTWVRFVRFTGNPITQDGSGWEVPEVIKAIEVASSATDRSVLGEWGQGNSWGPYEWEQPPSLVPPPDSGEPNDTPDTATPLDLGTAVTGYVHHDQDVDYYAVRTGPGQNTLTIAVDGTPTLGVRVQLFDASGTEVPTVFGNGAAPGSGAYVATVKPGSDYRVEVEQPTFTAVFAFDSSGSMTPYMPLIQQVQRAYLADRQQDDVPPLIINFRDDKTQAALVSANGALAGHDGARAIVLLTDWELAGYPATQDMWRTLGAVRPLVFGTFVGDLTPHEGDNAMHDIAMAGHGVFDYGTWHANGDHTFDRMVAWLRRPAEYTLSVVGSSKTVPPAKPATLSVVSAPPDNGGPARPTVAGDAAIEVILDTSGSMLTKLGNERRIDAARSVLTDLVTHDLPAGSPVAIRVFGDPAHPCGTTLPVPLGPLDPKVVDQIDGIQVYQQNDTPTGIALNDVPVDLAGASGTHIVVLITDSQEVWPNKDLCGVDPMTAVRALAATDTHVDVVGLSVTDRNARAALQALAHAGHGQFFAANDPSQLAQAVSTAVSAPFDVFDTTGARVAGGIVGGSPISLPPGTYRVVVRSNPAVTFDAVVLQGGGAVVLTLPGTTGTQGSQ